MNHIGYLGHMLAPATLSSPAPDFTPVPRSPLRGFTAEKQRRFIAALAATGSVTTAADDAGISRQSAYILRAAPGAEGFAAAWDAAVRTGIAALRSVAFDRAIHGEPVPVFHNGEQVGTRVQHNNQLLMRLLTHYDPDGGNVPAEDPDTGVPFPYSSHNVPLRIDSRRKDIGRMTPADFARNGEWMLVEEFRKQVRSLHLVGQVRLWMSHDKNDPLGQIVAQLAIYERKARANPMFTDEMVDEVLATGSLKQPWLQTASLARLIEKAEMVEAMAFMIKRRT